LNDFNLAKTVQNMQKNKLLDNKIKRQNRITRLENSKKCCTMDSDCSNHLLTDRPYIKEIIMITEKPTLYALSTCSHCKSTKKLLTECDVEYNYIQVDDLEGEERKAILADIKALNPRCSFPTIKINETVIVGYKEKEIKAALGIKNES